MLKQVVQSYYDKSCLITVQDNTMLKHNQKRIDYRQCLITVQDNTMLKL